MQIPQNGITVLQAAKLTGRNPETIRRWIRTGKVPAHLRERRWLVDLDAVQQYAMRPYGTTV